jgi:hypothetical protein
MVDLVDDPLWQPADTVALNANTQAVVDFLAQRKNSPELDQLWRIVPRLMHCLPPEIFDGRHLVCEADDVAIGGAQVRNPIWAADFCRALRSLVTHPFFRRSPRMLALAIQYAVKLRTNDRRRWPLESPTTDTFLDNLATAFGNAHPDRTAQQIHKEVRRAVKGQGKDTRLVSIVLREIENAVKPAEEDFQGSEEPFSPFVVTAADLKKVATALNNVKCCGVTVYLDADHTFLSVKSAMHSNDEPQRTSGVTNAMQMAYRRFGQLAILKERRAVIANAGATTGNAATNQNSGAETNSTGMADETPSPEMWTTFRYENAWMHDELSNAEDEIARLELDAAKMQALREVDAGKMRELQEENERLKAQLRGFQGH